MTNHNFEHYTFMHLMVLLLRLGMCTEEQVECPAGCINGYQVVMGHNDSDTVICTVCNGRQVY